MPIARRTKRNVRSCRDSKSRCSTRTPITWWAHANGALEPRELLRAFVRYKHVDYYDPALFTRTYDWMKARGLTEGGSDHAALVG
jgi:hypothetical protein